MCKWDIFLECKDDSIYANKSMWYITLIKWKKHMIISIDAEKVFHKFQHPFMWKALNKLGIAGTCLNIKKALHDSVEANMILFEER